MPQPRICSLQALAAGQRFTRRSRGRVSGWAYLILGKYAWRLKLNTDLSLFHLVANASVLVQLVMALLLVGSLYPVLLP